MSDQPGTGLLGRQEELATFERALKRAASGRLEVVLVEGEPGIGKSRFAAEAAQLAEAIGFSRWTARFEEMERVRSFGPLTDALGCTTSSDDPRRVEIAAALLSDGVPQLDSRQHFGIAEAVIDLMEEETLIRPRVLVLEDLHWADPSSLYTIRAVIKRLAYLPCVIVGTMRPLPRVPELQHLINGLESDGWLPMTLGKLDHEAVMNLVKDLLGAEPSPQIARRLSIAGGNPLFVIELLDALKKEGDVDQDHSEGSLPPDLRLTILRKISFLTDNSIELLRLAAILGSSFSATELAAVARRPLVELMPMLRECLTAQLIIEEHGKIRFRHELIRESLYFDLPESIRKGLHLEGARRLLEVGASSIQVAEHLLFGAEPGDSEAISILRRAANEAPRAPETRIALLQHAQWLHLENDPELVWTEADLADALVWGGRFDEAISLARSLLERSQEDQFKARLRRLIARAMRGDSARRSELLAFTKEWFAEGIEDEERALLTAVRASASLQSGVPPDVVAGEVEESLEIGARTDNDEVRVAALTELVNIRHHQGRVPEEISAARLALEIVEGNPAHELRSYHPHLWLGQAYELNSLFEEAERTLLEGLRQRELIGTAWDLPAYQAVLAVVYWRSGRWDEAIVAAASCLDATHDFSNADEVAHVILAEIAAYRGRSEEAKRHLGALDRLNTDSYPTGAEHAVRVQVAVVLNDVATAVPLIRAGLESDERPNLFLDPDVLSEATAFMLKAGEPTLAQAVVERFEDYAAGRTDPLMSAAVQAARTVLVDDPAGYEPALEELRRVRLWSVALLAEQAGACLARHSLTNEAKRYFDDALDSFETLDAQVPISRMKATMRSFGIHTGARGKRSRPKFGWEAVTDAERRVVELAARGLTNPQIADNLYLSRYTVQSHLKNVFQKLGIASRTELAAEVTRLLTRREDEAQES